MRLLIFDSLPSTMDTARENVASGRIRFDVHRQANYVGVLARMQTAGRGQRGRNWFAALDESLCVTYCWRRGLTEPERAGEIALLAGVAITQALSQRYGVGDAFGLKWPNDILLDDKKLGGVLVEMVMAPDKNWTALIGVGLNLSVQTFPPDITETATSLLQEGFEPPPVEALALEIAGALHRLADVRREEGFAAILKRWRERDQTPGRRYRTVWEGYTVSGVATGVAANGGLQLRLDDGRDMAVASASSLQEL